MSRTQVVLTWLVVGAVFLGLFLLFGVMTSAPWSPLAASMRKRVTMLLAFWIMSARISPPARSTVAASGATVRCTG